MDQISFGQLIAATRYKGLTNIFNHLRRTPLPPTKFLWTLSCPPKVQFFLSKALTEGLSTFYTNHPRCSSELKTVIRLQYQVDVDSWLTNLIVPDESWGIIYSYVTIS